MIYAPLKRTNREATDEHLKPFAGRNDERQEGTLTPSKRGPQTASRIA